MALTETQLEHVRRTAWRALQALARRPGAAREDQFRFGQGGNHDLSLLPLTAKLAQSPEFPFSKEDCLAASKILAEFSVVVREVFHLAYVEGLVLPKPGALWDVGRFDEPGYFLFTRLGLTVLVAVSWSPMEEGSLSAELDRMKQTGVAITDGEIALLDEAQRCAVRGCYRASTALIGLAHESRFLDLLDATCSKVAAPAGPSQIATDFGEAKNTSLQFSKRWHPGLRVLSALKAKLRGPGKNQPWWEPWESVPQALSGAGEAIRVARNTAVHDASEWFGRDATVLLLTSVPHLTRVLDGLLKFFQNPPLPIPGL